MVRDYVRNRSRGEEFYGIIRSITNLVIVRHFSGYPLTMYDDFYSTAVFKVCKTIDVFDFERDLFTFLYGIIRNEIRNWIYHFVDKTASHSDIEDYCDSKEISSSRKDSDIIDTISYKEYIDREFDHSNFINMEEGLMDFINVLHHMKYHSESGHSMFKDTDDIFQFSLFASLYVHNEVFIKLFLFYSSFRESRDYESLLVLVSYLKTNIPKPVTVKRIVDDFSLFKKNLNNIELNAARLPKRLLDIEKIFIKNYNMSLLDIYNYIFKEKKVDFSIFTKQSRKAINESRN